MPKIVNNTQKSNPEVDLKYLLMELELLNLKNMIFLLCDKVRLGWNEQYRHISVRKSQIKK